MGEGDGDQPGVGEKGEGVRVLGLEEGDETAGQCCGVAKGREGDRAAVFGKMSVGKTVIRPEKVARAKAQGAPTRRA